MAPRTLSTKHETIIVLKKLISHLQISFEGEQDAADAYGVNEDLDRACKLLAKLTK